MNTDKTKKVDTKDEEVSESIAKGALKITPKMGEAFMEKVKQEYMNKYAQDVVHMIEDRNQLEKALNTLNKWIKAIENGNFEYIKVYNKKRSLLAQIEDGDFE